MCILYVFVQITMLCKYSKWKTTDIMKALKARFAGEFCTIEHFNLRKIAVPNKFDQKIIDKVVKAQEYQTALNIAKTAYELSCK